MTNIKRKKIYDLIDKERDFQESKHPQWLKINEVALCILSEEFGEIGKAINENDMQNLLEEIIDTAAVCVRWAEGLMEVKEKQEHVELLSGKKLTKEQVEAWERLGYDMKDWRN